MIKPYKPKKKDKLIAIHKRTGVVARDMPLTVTKVHSYHGNITMIEGKDSRENKRQFRTFKSCVGKEIIDTRYRFERAAITSGKKLSVDKI